jgi:hypothetical protein
MEEPKVVESEIYIHSSQGSIRCGRIRESDGKSERTFFSTSTSKTSFKVELTLISLAVFPPDPPHLWPVLIEDVTEATGIRLRLMIGRTPNSFGRRRT